MGTAKLKKLFLVLIVPIFFFIFPAISQADFKFDWVPNDDPTSVPVAYIVNFNNGVEMVGTGIIGPSLGQLNYKRANGQKVFIANFSSFGLVGGTTVSGNQASGGFGVWQVLSLRGVRGGLSFDFTTGLDEDRKFKDGFGFFFGFSIDNLWEQLTK